ncbi:hypothetical protein C8J56DRAFT_930912 [Mycena floridula]|nr:hypothetical protein C8J56DRAFT_930912 [Mycena floridula]
MGTDYYALLGVSKTADEAEIKRAYKKMALKWHPDRNNGSEEASKKFQKISEAFEVLTDSNKRAVYDQFGEEGLKNGGPVPGQGAGPDTFSNFSSGGFPGGTFSFSSSGPGGFSSGGFAPTDPQKIFEQFFAQMGGGGMGGTKRSAHAFDDDDDDPMDGASFSFGGMPGSMPRQKFRSAQPSSSRPPAEISRPLKVSLEDLYTGSVKHLKVGRRLVDGTTEDKILDIQIHPGWKVGTKIRFSGAGNEQANGQSQDLVFVVEEKPHPLFTRDGNDLVCRISIPLVEALTGVTGGKKVVELLDGRKLQVPVPSGIVKPNQETTVPREGMPIRKDGSMQSKGNLVVKWDVTFPTILTASQKEGLRKILA